MAAERVLVIVDDSYDFPERDVPRWAIEELLNASEVSVVAPALGTRLSVATDDDVPARQAAARLRAVVTFMQSIGVDARGQVSRDSPQQALETFLLDHDIDRILIGATLEGHWRERGLLEHVEAVAGARVACVRVTHNSPPTASVMLRQAAAGER